jgi:hypothetical protein
VWTRWLLGCAIACALWPHAAVADRIGVVAVASDPGDRSSVAAAVARTLAEDPSGTTVVPDAIATARDGLARGAVPVELLATFRHVRELIDEGWRAYLRVEFDLAQSRLAVARTEAEQIYALPGGPELYADVSLRLGIVLGALGHVDDAQAALALALAIDPSRPINAAEFSPELIASIDAARARVAPIRHTTITSEPPGAAVTLDGTPIGTTPLTTDLAHGQHVAVLRARGFAARAQPFAVADSEARVEVVLDRDDERANLDGGAIIGMADAREQALLDAATRYADVDQVVLAAQTGRRGGGALLVQRCAGLPSRCSAVVEIGYGERDGLQTAARSAWQAVRAADLRYPPSVLADPRLAGERVATHSCELCRSPWVWGGVGTVALAAIVTVVAVVTASKPAPSVTVDPGQFFK